jgi:hypothetical protein
MSQITVGSVSPNFFPFICGISADDGGVYCLGENAGGQLGTGAYGARAQALFYFWSGGYSLLLLCLSVETTPCDTPVALFAGDRVNRPQSQDPDRLDFSIGPESGTPLWVTAGDTYTCVQLRWGRDETFPVYFATVSTCWGVLCAHGSA